MKKALRDCVKNINRNKNVDALLPEYVSESMNINYEYAKLKMMMEYYVYYETLTEGMNTYIPSVKNEVDALNEVVGTFFAERINEKKEFSDDDKKVLSELKKKLLDLRQNVIDRMKVLTSYVDCFVVYEYVLNRIQYRFDDMELLPDDNAFAQDVVNFIFGTKDNVAINDNIHCVIGQLPMRMTRSRYFDIVKESISVYKNSDVSSLESFLYMFRTNAMLYKDENRDKYFTEFEPVLAELSGLDYDNMTKELYDIYADKIRVSASKLNDISDLYMQLGQLINNMYVIVSAAEYTTDVQADVTDIVIKGIYALFMEKDSDVWNGEIRDASEEEKLEFLSEYFPRIEGRQENVYDALNMTGAILEETIDSQKQAIEKNNLSEQFIVLKQMSKLTSNSVFAELDEAISDEKVTPDMVEKVTAELISELKELFKGSSRMLRRAVMANTLEKIPVFFNTPQEVADYVMASLGQCEDEAEKYASKQLVLELMR